MLSLTVKFPLAAFSISLIYISTPRFYSSLRRKYRKKKIGKIAETNKKNTFSFLKDSFKWRLMPVLPAVFDLLRRRSDGGRGRWRRLKLPGEAAVRYTAVRHTVKIPLLFRRDFPLELHQAGRLQRISGRQSCDFQQTQHYISWLAVQHCKNISHANVLFYVLCNRIYKISYIMYAVIELYFLCIFY